MKNLIIALLLVCALTIHSKILYANEAVDASDVTDEIIIEQDLVTKTKKIKDFKDYINFLKSNRIIVDHKEREEIILKKIR